MTTEFVGTCITLRCADLNAFDDSARDICYRTFRKHVGALVVRGINEWSGVPLSRDWHVTYSKGRWRGAPAVCMHHSSIHHIYKIYENK